MQSSQVTVVNGPGNCLYPFKIGESYLVYANQEAGALTTSICTRTQPVADATADLTYARSMAAIRPGTPARVARRVQLSEWPSPSNGQLKPMPGTVVMATGEGGTFSGTANDRGEFVLTGLPLGKYELRPGAPFGYAGVSRIVELFGDYLLGFNSIRGIDGRLIFSGIDGRLMFSRAFYPGVRDPSAASTVAVGIGERVQLRDFVVPDVINLVTVNGVVVDEDSLPVSNAIIVLRDGRERVLGSQFVTGDDGRFAFALIDGVFKGVSRS